MLLVKFLAGLGALMGIYAAAALQIGPEQADANLCKLLRRLFSGVPEQCVASIDNYGTLLLVLFVVACVVLLLWDFRKNVFVSRQVTATLKRYMALVEPSHIIILGLAIAMGGVIWQWQKLPPPDPKIVQLQSQLEAVHKQVADTREPKRPTTRLGQIEASGVPAKQPQMRVYTAYEREQKLPVINEFRDLLEGPMQYVIDNGPRLQTNWWNAINDSKSHPKFQQELAEYREKLATSLQELESLKRKHQRHKEIIDPIEITVTDSVRHKVNDFLIAFQTAQTSMKPESSYEAFDVLMKRPAEHFGDAVRTFTGWRNVTLDKLSAIEKQIIQ